MKPNRFSMGVLRGVEGDGAGAGGAGGDPWAGHLPPKGGDLTERLQAVLVKSGLAEGDGKAEGRAKGAKEEEGDEDGEEEEGEEEEDADEEEGEPEGDEEEGDEDADGEDAEDEEDAPAKPGKALKEAEAKVKEAEERAKEAEAKLASGKVQVVSADVPLADVATLEDLKKVRREADDLWDWCQENPQGGECPYVLENGKPKEVEAAEVSRMRKWAKEMIRDQVPAREKWLAEDERLSAFAVKAVPALGKASSKESVEVDKVLKAHKSLRLEPGAKLLALEVSVGRRLTEAFGPHALELAEQMVAAGKKKKDAPGKKPTRDVAGKPRKPEGKSGGKSAKPKSMEDRVMKSLGL